MAASAPSADVIKQLKDFSDVAPSWIGLLLKISVVAGGGILPLYSAQEQFLYDTSSVSAIAVLIFVAYGFGVVLLFVWGYGAVTSVWIIAFGCWLYRLMAKQPDAHRLIPELDRWRCLLLLS